MGIVAFPESIPLVIFSVVAGALADRVGYIRITILAQTATTIAAAAFAAITLLGLMTAALIVVFALLIGGVGSQTLIQNAVASDVRAWVMSLFIIISWGLPPFARWQPAGLPVLLAYRQPSSREVS